MTRSRIASVGLLAVALAASGAAAPAQAKKKENVFDEIKVVNTAIPDDPGGGLMGPPSVSVTSEIRVPKKYKGKVVGDLNVLDIQTTGFASGAANDLTASLRAPSGRTMRLFGNFNGDISLGPWTLDDDTPVSICNRDPGGVVDPCADPMFSLYRPFAGASNTHYTGTAGSGPLARFDGAKMRGTWTFIITDVRSDNPMEVSNLNTWGLEITPAKD